MSEEQNIEVPVEYTGGETLQFVGYAGGLQEGQEALLNEDEFLRVDTVQKDGGMIVTPVDEKGTPLKGRQQDTVFPEETKFISTAPPPPKAKAAKKAAAKTEAVEDVAPVVAKVRVTAVDPATKKAASSVAKSTAKAKTAAKVLPVKAEAPAKKDSKSVKPKTTEVPVAAKIEPRATILTHDAQVIETLEELGALKAAKSLVARAEETYFTLGGVLREIFDHSIYEKAGYSGKKGFHAYVETELGIEYRKARYLIGIYEAFRAAKISRTQMAKMGWSKAKELARLSAEDLRKNFADLSKYANDHTRDELQAHIKANYSVVTRDGESLKTVKYRFAFTNDEATVVERGMNAARGLVEEGDDNKALEYIIGEWLVMREGGAIPDQTFEDVDALIGYAEEAFGVLLTQVDDSQKAEAEDEAEAEVE